ncbi:SMC-Scp complex subunit ScpB [Yimella sp. cx-51]|uniref:SMC-Scp complex subunit ScpB n=1 Tax=Yimella sp. cx-51 TaxID=2770551 RepID=UPI00165DA536|nr:SMC-Scp complex subunit ScpB [Yimella sp. cx-51]MBC9957758.1 SMC-Scp complex subunit ScpB [Yimella sp. cx-51]MBD2758774.1 SMC-Scp complex subunit ScpB [Yimella sp. cx-573]QTH36899.1 SMC-Scp complex subunit ScpB [Yimella sp. cx-51]
MSEPPQHLDVELPGSAPAAEPEGFDVDDFPGGARSTIEAILMVVDQPLTVLDLADALELEEAEVREHLEALESEYASQHRGFALREINGGWRVYSRPAYAPAVEKFLMGGQQAKLTQASLETLAVIAYRQPISRSRVSAVRGVNVDGVIRTLTTRGLIAEMGTDGEGGAMLYGTTPFFLQRMGLSSLDELPALAPYLPDTDVIDELIEQGQA